MLHLLPDFPLFRFEVSQTGGLQGFSNGLIDLLEQSVDVLTGQMLWDLFQPQKPFQCSFDTVRYFIQQGHGPLEYLADYVHHGTNLPVLISLYCQPEGLMGYLTPLWEESKQQKSIQQLEARLDALYRASNQMIVILDKEHCILDFNQWASDAAGLRFGRKMGRGEDFINYVQPDRLADFYASFQEVLDGKHIFKERLIHAPDRQILTYAMTYTPIYNELGEISSVYFIGVNVEERRQMQLLLSQEQSFVSSILNATNALIIVVDGFGRIIRFNKASEALTGYAASEVQDRVLWEFLVPAGEERQIREQYQNIFQGLDPPQHVQYSLQAKNGSVHPVSWSLNVMPGLKENTLYIVSTGIDLTERLAAEAALKESEAMLRQAQKMEAIGHLAGGIAHDFNNMLTAFMGYGQLLEAHIKPGSEGEEYLSEIQRMCHNARVLTSQLLMFARKAPPEIQIVDIHHVISEIHGLVLRVLGDKIQLNLNLTTDTLLIHANAIHLEQVLMNLMVNARDALGAEGVVSISSGQYRLKTGFSEPIFGYFQAGDYVFLTISDTGCGMDSETCKYIFDPFFTTKEKGKGTGLGMAVVYRIMKEFGGWVDVLSEPGQGSSFKLYFPSYQEEPLTKECSDRFILYQLSNEQTQKISHFLRPYPYDLQQVNTYADLMRCFESETIPSLIITELSDYRVNGYRLLLQQYPQLKVLYLAGDSAEEMLLLDELAHQEDVLIQPFFEYQLLHRVGVMLGYDKANQTMP